MSLEQQESMHFNDYEAFAEAYVKRTESNSHNAYYERPAMFSLLSHIKFKRVLDAGCAGGIYSEWLINHGAEVVSIDISNKMVKLTQERLKDRGEVYQADLNQPLTFLNNNSFDLILSSLTLHYLRDWEQVFQEFHRILSPKGLFLFSTHHPFMDFQLFEKADYFATDLLEDSWQGYGNTPVSVRFYRRPLSAMTSALKSAGFVIKQIVEPRPTEECKQLYPQDYEKLSQKPWFLIILAQKTT
ncbi:MULTISPECIES: class I SAM-dependent methyltransferase [unclassified Nodularia (in: cyanobacteria)]|uniref:class I SAM-dependent methyltransferase n=1 Tax=unclassified Nodularia (in: cyanobacteria) TaxID=2656917 RepID=UPI001881E72F|nr:MULTISPECIES: class I SAM-dependent methyltransferase [unclassified Nodularia (in: cyanobacteria)]MBE9197592.1 class I SAM-dependent methyltransferase [Nodularia sp. LEGE 06071]MCC2692097.1 class I SAM-dependent methyltransferase [Nodularia sp. LEGE 04288]